jgi:hypothetical protein
MLVWGNFEMDSIREHICIIHLLFRAGWGFERDEGNGVCFGVQAIGNSL